MPDASDLLLSPRHAYSVLDAVRVQRPLVQNITNYVAMTFAANVLLAAGASPAMVHAEDEAEEFSAIAQALTVNIGTLSTDWISSMLKTAGLYAAQGKPFVVDPVGAGATSLRTRTSLALLNLKPAILRANAGEILALSGASGGLKGVDATVGSQAALAGAQALAERFSTVVAVTGEIDFVTDGRRVVALHGGSALMPLSTATGCALSAMCGAFAAVTAPFEAAFAACAVYKAAGSIAAEGLNGPGLLPARMVDALYTLDEKALSTHVQIEVL
jgi:hydroxyethylthiazole kinase